MREIQRHINLDALAANFLILRKLVAQSEVAAVVKADCYGLGVNKIAPALSNAGCETFYIATLEEGLQLRQLLPCASIFVLNGIATYPTERFIEARLTPVLNSSTDIRRWSRQSGHHPCAIHVDTGMNRLGLSPQELVRLQGDGETIDQLNVVLLISHLACADEADHPLNVLQLSRFTKVNDLFPAAPSSLANSSGLFLGPQYHFQQCRAGAALFGVNPTPGLSNPMQPVLEVTAPVVQIRSNSSGSVGYGATAQLKTPKRLAVIAAGYADGYPRHASNRGQVVINGQMAPLIGRVSMDLITVDISHLQSNSIQIGDQALLVGEDYGINELANAADTIGYEILTNLGRHAKTTYR
ncbi:MAG TPA: alanine racemase [Gammaproteobacteria bacterium]|nr:alanine racemase [Gammaproteobacteria bacterium]